MLPMSLLSTGICEWSRPSGRRCTPASWFAPGRTLPQRGQLDAHGGSYPAFSPLRSGLLAGCQGCGAPPRRQHGASKAAGGGGAASPETTRPSVQLSAALAAAGSEGERSDASRDRRSPCATWGLTASCAPRQRHWGSCRPGGSLWIPLSQCKHRLQPLAAASLRCGSQLQLSRADLVPVEGCPEQQPHNIVQSCVVLLHRVRGKQAGVSKDVGFVFCRATGMVSYN